MLADTTLANTAPRDLYPARDSGGGRCRARLDVVRPCYGIMTSVLALIRRARPNACRVARVACDVACAIGAAWRVLWPWRAREPWVPARHSTVARWCLSRWLPRCRSRRPFHSRRNSRAGMAGRGGGCSMVRAWSSHTPAPEPRAVRWPRHAQPSKAPPASRC